MVSSPNIVITGLGVISPIGIGREPFWQSLCQQRSGIAVVDEYATARDWVRLGGVVRDFEPKRYVKPRKSLKVMSREVQIGFSVADAAVEDSQLTSEQVDPDRLGVLFGAEMFYCEPRELADVCRRCHVDGQFDFSHWGEASEAEMYPLWMLRFLPNMIACHVGISRDARGPNNTICQGEVSSLLALIEAAQIIQRGDADAMIVGGSSSRLAATPAVYRGNLGLSWNPVAGEACRPFDAARDGTVNGEGAAAFVIENEQTAQARGAKILARLTGWGMSFGRPSSDSSQHGRAICDSIQMALQAARLDPREVGHVNAHATGSIENDPVEAQAIRATMADVPVTAPKSYFGHLGASGGAVEMAASILAFERGEIPVTLNYSQPDPECPIDVVHSQARPLQRPTAIKLSQSVSGQTVAVALAGA